MENEGNKQVNKIKKLIKNTVIIFLGKISTQFISFLLLPLYTSCISTSEYGYVDLVTTYTSLLVILIIVQLDMATFRFLIDYREDEDGKNKVVSNVFICVMIFTVFFIFLYFIANIVINLQNMWLVLLVIIANIFSSVFIQVARGLGKNTDYSISCIIGGVTTIILNIILIVKFKFGAVGLLISMIVSNTAISLYLLFKLKILKMIRFKHKDKKMIKELIKYSAPLVPNQLSLWIVSISDRIIISAILSTTENGIYSIANKFSTILNSIYSIFYLAWSEQAALYFKEDDKESYFSLVINNGIKVFGTICLLIITGLPIVFNILVNSNYAEAYYQIPILLLGTLCSLIVGLIGVIYVAKKMTKEIAKTSVVATIINVLVNVLFIKNFGLYAASISTFIAYFVVMIYRWFDIKKYIYIKLEQRSIFILIICFVFSIYTYYINIFNINITSFLLSILLSIYINKNSLIVIAKNFKIKISKRYFKNN